MLCVFALLCLAAGAWSRAPVYDCFVRGARKGLETAVQVLPALAAMLPAVRALEESGLMGAALGLVAPWTEKIGLPPALLPLMAVRPLSGSGAMAMLNDIMARYGPDSREALLAGVMMGSSETVFYTVTVYLSAAGVKESRHIVPCAMLACLAGYAGALLFCP